MKTIASDELHIGFAVFIAGFVLVQRSGLISAGGEGVLRILAKAPALVVVGMLLVNVLVRMILLINGRAPDKSRRVVSVIFHAGLFLVTAGIIVSSQTRFEGTIVMAEGQTSGSGGVSFRVGSVHSAPHASGSLPEVSLMHVVPSFSGKGMSLWNIKAFMTYREPLRHREKAIECNLLYPSLVDGTFFLVRDFGYAPRYQITDPSGAVLDEAYVLLNLFPPGSEDSFTVMAMPDRFYVRYYPDGSLAGGEKRSVAGDNPRPLYKLRIARNLDLVLPTTALAPFEKALIKPESIAFVDMRKWVELEVVKDYGLFLIAPGSLMMLGSALRGLLTKTNIFRLES